jgi:hypothetical protein
MVRRCSNSSRAASAEAPGVLSPTILETSGMLSIFTASGFFVSVFFLGIGGAGSSFFFSAGFSGESNLMIFRSGSGFFAGSSAGFAGSFTSGIFSAVGVESSLEGPGSFFPSFNFICTPPYIPTSC